VVGGYFFQRYWTKRNARLVTEFVDDMVRGLVWFDYWWGAKEDSGRFSPPPSPRTFIHKTYTPSAPRRSFFHM
jgi:hypothetical protein